MTYLCLRHIRCYVAIALCLSNGFFASLLGHLLQSYLVLVIILVCCFIDGEPMLQEILAKEEGKTLEFKESANSLQGIIKTVNNHCLKADGLMVYEVATYCNTACIVTSYFLGPSGQSILPLLTIFQKRAYANSLFYFRKTICDYHQSENV